MIPKVNQSSDLLAKVLFCLIVFAWSTSWYAIKFQLGIVPEGMSVAYRFFGASIILFLIVFFNKFRLKFSKKQHFIIFCQGAALFFLNHLFFYKGMHYVSSGVAAIFSSLGIIVGAIFDYWFHKNKTSGRVIFGGFVGIVGVGFIFSTEIINQGFGWPLIKGLLFCLGGVTVFTFGSVVGKSITLKKSELISSTAYAMAYGATISFLFTICCGEKIIFDFRAPYILSMIYLILIPGIIGYVGILYLVGKWGASRASYTALFYPVGALIVSSIFENYHFGLFAFVGIIFILIGNGIAIKSKV